MSNIRAELAKFPENVQDKVVILFSAHSLPMSVCIILLSLTLFSCIKIPGKYT